MRACYEEMLPHEIVAARQAHPVAYLPIGGLEWHGEHLPVGTDALKAHALAVRCAERGGGLVFPVLYWGEPRESHLMEASRDPDGQIAARMALPRENLAAGYMRVMPAESHLFYVQILLHAQRQIASLGFRAIVILAGHYPLLRHARAAVELYMLDSPRAQAWAATGYELVRSEIPDAGDHAAKWETSLLMALRPELVDLSRLPADPTQPLVGVNGIDPRGNASQEFGERAVQAIVARIVAHVQTMLAAAR